MGFLSFRVFTLNYHRTVLGIKLLQGYGLTETSACGAIMAFDQHTTGDVGPPVQGVHIRFFYNKLSYTRV